MSVQAEKVTKLISLISKSPGIDVLPLLLPRIKVDQQAAPTTTDPLITMSRALLNTLLLQKQLKLYRRSSTDINGYDFNWNDKRSGHNYNRTHSLNKYLTHFAMQNELYGISIAGNTLKNRHQLLPPPRVIHAKDNRAILIVLGWCQWQSCLDLQKVRSLIISNDTLNLYH